MIYRRPTSPVFWVPMPDTGQSRMDLIDWLLVPDKKPVQMTLTDPETGDYTVEILDYMAFKIDECPGWIARTIINKDATGRMLAQLLQTRIPEFKTCKKVLFYQVNPINQTT